LLVDADIQQARHLAESTELGSIVIAGIEQADVSDSKKIVGLMRSCVIVINTVGPFFRFGRVALEAALEAGVHYVDVNDDVESLKDLLQDTRIEAAIQKSTSSFVVGAGTSPGSTGHMARIGAAMLDRVESIHVFLAATISWRGYPVFSHFTHSMGQPSEFFLKGKLEQVQPFAKKELVRFLGIDEDTVCYAVGHPEPVVFPRNFTEVEEVTMKLGRIPNSLMEMFHHFYMYGLMDTTPINLDNGTEIAPADFTAAYLASDAADKIFGFSTAKPLSARLVKVIGQIAGEKATISCYHTSVSISGQDAAIIASLLIRGELLVEGLTTAEALDPWRIMKELLEEEGAFCVTHEEETRTFTDLSELDQYRRDT
tara:strand:- start:297 stop:1406 length:1110 start_codon:yes stop_codon:yes gene_type:complete